MRNHQLFLDAISNFLEQKNWFDYEYYLTSYPDVKSYPGQPIRHFVEHGITEHRNPKSGSMLPSLRKTFSMLVASVADYSFATDDSIHFFKWMLTHLKLIEKLKETLSISGDNLSQVVNTYRLSGGTLPKLPPIKPHEQLSVTDKFLCALFCSADISGAIELLKNIDALNQSGINHDISTISASGLFDSAYYFERYTDIRNQNIDPIRHYLEHGARENRNPSRDFSTEFYLANNDDVSQSGMNPLLHFVAFGRDEGRSGLPALIRIARPATDSIDRRSHFVESIGKFLTAAEHAEVIAFDFFDTLVERKNPDPTFIFTIMQSHKTVESLGIRNFRKMRIDAERRARSMRDDEVRIEEIYSELSRRTHLSKRDVNDLISLEKSVEFDNLVIRPIGCELLTRARATNAKLAIVSDFYFDQSFLRDILSRLQVNSDDLEFFVSSESRKTKHRGDLFDHVVDHFNTRHERILHIGDNEHSDYEVPLDLGILACLLPHSQFMRGVSSEIDRCIHASTAVVSRHLATRVALSAYRSDRKIDSPGNYDEAVEFGYKIIGPLLLCMMRYLDKIFINQASHHAVFLSRDTKLIFDAFRQNSSSLKHDRQYSYLLCSRQCIFGMSSEDHESVTRIVRRDYKEMSFRNMLRNRFLFNDSELGRLERKNAWLRIAPHYAAAGNMNETVEIFCDYAGKLLPEIYQVAAKNKSVYDRYISSVIPDRAMLVDIGYRGTTQKAFCELLDRPMNAAYLMTWPDIAAIRRLGLASFEFVESGTQTQLDLTKHVSLLELVLSDPQGASVRNFEIDPVSKKPYAKFCESELDHVQKQYLTNAHDAALEFVSENASLLTAPIEDGSPEQIFAPLLAFFTRPPTLFSKIFENAVFEDNFGGASASLFGSSRKRH